MLVLLKWPVTERLCCKKTPFNLLMNFRKGAVGLVARKRRDDSAVPDVNWIVPGGAIDWRLEKIHRRVRPLQTKFFHHVVPVAT